MSQRQQMFAQDEPADCVCQRHRGVGRLPPAARWTQAGCFAIPGDFLWTFHVGRSARCSARKRWSRSTPASSQLEYARAARVDERPHLLRRLYDLASHELSLAQEQMVIIGRRTAEERVVCFPDRPAQRAGRSSITLVTVPLPMTWQDIADFLGLDDRDRQPRHFQAGARRSCRSGTAYAR